MSKVLSFVFLASLILAGLSACGGDDSGSRTQSLYVDATKGRDANNCSLAASCKTIQKAIDQAQPGDQVIVAAGDYAEGLRINKHGLTLAGEIGSRPNVVLPPGAAGGVGNVFITASDVTITNIRVQKSDTKSETALISAPVATGPGTGASLLENLRIIDVIGDGAKYGASLSANNLTVTNSSWLHQGSDSLLVRASQGSAQITGNTFEGAGGRAIAYESQSGSPATTGTIAVNKNISTGKAALFVYNQWVDSATASKVAIDVSVNRMSGLTSNAIVVADRAAAGTNNHSHIASFGAHFNEIPAHRGGAYGIRNELAGGDPVHIEGQNNWFGCNKGPVSPDCASVDAAVTATPWLVLTLTPTARSVGEGLNIRVDAHLNRNSDAVAIDTLDRVLNGGSVAFAGKSGAVTTPIPMVDGVASTTFTASGQIGRASVSATLDAQTVTVPITIVRSTPDVPRSVVGVSTAPGSITVTWKPPASAGVSPIASYTVTAIDNDTANPKPSGRCGTANGVLTCTVTNIGGRRLYNVTVWAANAVGQGPGSAAIQVKTK